MPTRKDLTRTESNPIPHNSRAKIKGKKDARDGGQYTIPSGPKCFRCQGFDHMKQECPTYLKNIEKSKALVATLSDTKSEDDSNNEDDGILNAFTATINPTEGIVEDVDEEEDLVESKFEENDEQDDIHTTFAKLYKVSEKHEKLYKSATKKLEAELFQVRAQLEKNSSAKLNEMLSLQKSASDRISLGYDFSSPSIASTSTTVFVAPANNVETENNDVKNELASENVDKGKSILEAPPKLDEKDIKNSRAKKGNTQKLKQKKQHFYHHCGAARHT